jgi:hypothetical protein
MSRKKLPLLALFLLLEALNVAALSTGDGSSDHHIRFQTLMHSGDHQGAYQVAEQLVRLKPDDGFSW